MSDAATAKRPSRLMFWNAMLNTTQRWQVRLTWIALLLTVLSGLLLRGMQVDGGDRDPFMAVHSQHVGWAILVLCLALPSAMFVALCRPDRSRFGAGPMWNRLGALLRLGGLVSHASASLLILAPLLPGVEQAVVRYALPLLLISLLLYGLADLLLAWCSHERWSRLVAAGLTLVGIGVLYAPMVVMTTLAFRSPEARAAGATFFPFGLAFVLLPTTLLMLRETWGEGVARRRWRTRGLSIIVVFGACLILVFAGVAVAIWTVPQDVGASYVNVAAHHALLGPPPLLWLFLSGLRNIESELPRLSRVAVLVTLGFFIGGVSTEVLLGLDDLPSRYARHDVAFAPAYRVAAIVWSAFVISLAVTVTTWPRARKPISHLEFD